MGLFQIIKAVLGGQTYSVGTSTSTSTGTSSGGDHLPSRVRSSVSSTHSERQTVNGQTRHARHSFRRFEIDPADLPAWVAGLTPTAPPGEPPAPPAGVDWWLPPADASYYGAGALAGGDDGFLAVAPDGQTLYLYSASFGG